MFFRIVTPCRLVGRYQRFGETQLGVTTQKNIITVLNGDQEESFQDQLKVREDDNCIRGSGPQDPICRPYSICLLVAQTAVQCARLTVLPKDGRNAYKPQRASLLAFLLRNSGTVFKSLHGQTYFTYR
jgi:hypothetical protein